MLKTILLFSITGFIFLISCTGEPAQTPDQLTDSTAVTAIISEDPNAYDSLLAQELGADDYGMKMYVMAFLKAGPNRDRDSAEAVELQARHMDNIQRLADEGKLILAGPFGDDGDLRGIFLFDVATIEEAEELTKSDPAVQAGSLVMELHPWYGSAALMQVNTIHRKIQKEDF